MDGVGAICVPSREGLGFALLCDELLLQIFHCLDIPELLALSRTNHHLRDLTRDPLLHSQRLHIAGTRLSASLQARPSLASLRPPTRSIYLTRAHIVARHLDRKLICIKLQRSLIRRPSAASLVSANIVPQECCKCDRSTGKVLWNNGLAPSIVDKKRKLDRERLKDGLRCLLQTSAVRVQERARAETPEHLSVGALIRRFTHRDKNKMSVLPSQAGDPEKRSYDGLREDQPTRVKVLGLRKFWEGIAGNRLSVVGA